MRRIPPYIDCILQYYLMETCGQITCTARTRGTIGGQKRHDHNEIQLVPPVPIAISRRVSAHPQIHRL